MKRLNNLTRRSILALLAGLVLTLAFGAQSAQAQQLLQPFVECVERERDSGGALTGNYTVYFGYTGINTEPITLPYRSGNNFFSPDVTVLNPPTVFFPGVHRRVVAVTLPISSNITWFLGTDFTIGGFSGNRLCGDSGANSRLITYQGKLSDGAAAANGVYDLQFQLFNQLTSGAARTSLITLEDVTVTNGIFTVRLDLGVNSLPAGSPGATAPSDLKLNPAILDAENSFVEIGVRAGTSTGAYTTLTPRQPLTAVPLAMRAESAATAYRAVNADNATNLGGTAANQFVQTNDARLSNARTPTAGSSNYIQNTTTQQSGSFNISGNGTIGGTLTANTATVNQTLTATTTNISGATERLLNVQGSSPIGTWITLNNTTTGGHNWSIISTGESNGEGAGKLLFYDLANNTGRLLLSDSGATITGNLTVSGAISGATKNFKIDHPLDPLNKTLTYTSVESPDMKNIYDGNITTDANGDAIVTMPAYFEALNKDFRYQLTVIGTFAQAIVFEKIKGNQFKIKTDKPNVEVSWQVTGIRHDKFAEDKQTPVEQEKPAVDQGKCLYAPACGQKR